MGIGSSIEKIDVSTSPAVLKFSLILALGIVALLTLLNYLFKGVGLYSMAKRQGLKNKFLAWIPVVSYYYMGKIAGESSIFGLKVKNAGLWTAIIVALSAFCTVWLDIVMYYNFAYNLFINDVVVETAETLPRTSTIIYLISQVLDIAKIILIFSLYIKLFRKYDPKRGFLYTILAFFFSTPLEGIFIFVTRNNKPINIEEYIRTYRRPNNNFYGNNYYNQYGNRYNNQYNNQYSNNTNNQEREKPKDPFEEFGTNKDDPFDDFN